MDVIKSANLALRFLLELAAIVAFGYWGFTIGAGTLMRFALGLGVPLLVIVIWALFVAPNAAVPLPGPVAFAVGLVILELAAAALAMAGQRTWSIVFAVVVLMNAALMAIWKQ